ncbi:neutral amino acid transporter [Lunasporangiospora selenospora]|uniref:Neutral amino acid transporter n=1 Tax=Lunasporangiospora selenospora TaxID=979761 RepID=A0A9P6FSK7_9FUNG|nr:neutral amino acid transporter [Lunasporangiospora selenospora]
MSDAREGEQTRHSASEEQRGRPQFLAMTVPNSNHQVRSNPNSRANSRTRSRPTSRSRPGSRAGSRPVSWLVQTNSEYANMFENYGGQASQPPSDVEDNDVSMAEKGSAARPKASRVGSTILPSNEKMATPGTVRPSMSRQPSAMAEPGQKTLIHEDYSSSDGHSDSSAEAVEAPRGTVTPWKASFLLAKAFVGTGVLFLPKAFMNGGILFSSLLLAFVAIVCCVSFLLLVKVRLVVRETFQDIGLVLFGKWARFFVLLSVALSQIGFCCAYLIFVSQNIDAVVQTFTKCTFHGIKEKYYIFIPLIILIPLVLIRRMSILSLPSMLANLFIIFGIVYLWYFSIDSIAHNGAGPNIALFNSNDFALFIGTAVFSFEGIGLVIPITESMAEPEKFPKVLALTITVVALIFASVGALGYAAFGSNVQTIVVLNLPIESGWTITVQILYSLAIILSVPLMLSPASKIIEHGIFGTKSGGLDIKIKMQKNVVRIVLICVCAVISFVVGGPNLDKFVSFVGSVACMPLCFIFPAMFHYKACAKSLRVKILDIILGVFGAIAMIFTLYITIRSWVVQSAGDTPIDRCAVFA